MRLFKGIALCLIVFSQTPRVNSQTRYGLVLGNYAGVNSIQLNPAEMYSSRSWLDIRLVDLGAFLQNNYLYLQRSDYKFRHFFQSGYQWPYHEEGVGTELRYFYHYDTRLPKTFFTETRVDGPAAMLTWGKQSFAITTTFRNIVSAYNVPYDMANFMYMGLNYRPQQNINYQDNNTWDITQLAWAEIGLTYARKVYSSDYTLVAAGVTVKRLFGYAGLFLHTNNINYTVIDDSTFQIKNLKAEMGISMPLDYTTNQIAGSTSFRGGGFGVDVGVTYTRLLLPYRRQYFDRLCAQRYDDYLYRIGVALIDFGGITFKTNAQKMAIDNRSSYWDQATRINFRSIDQIMDTLSYKFYGDTNTAMVANKFTLWLPSALSVQFDYHFARNAFVNASLILPVPIAKATVHRPAELTITPRYEKRWLEVSMPVSLYDWYLPRIGLAVRIYGITIGTDKLGGYFNFNDFTGLDVYFSIKFFLDKGSCRDRRKGGCGNLEYRKT